MWSRRSTKTSPPWSRRVSAQPATVTRLAGVVRPQLAAHHVAPGHPDLYERAHDAVLLPAPPHLVRSVAARDDDGLRTEPLRLRELPLHRAASVVGVDRAALRPPLGDLRQEPAAQLRLFAGDEEVEPRRLGSRTFALHREQEPLEPGAEADAGRRRPTDRLDQAVVAAAAADRGVDVLLGPDELEGRARVVVEAAHERRVEDVPHPVRVEVRPDGVEVLAAGVAERVADLRRVRERGENLLVLDVEDLENARRALVGDLLVHAARDGRRATR